MASLSQIVYSSLSLVVVWSIFIISDVQMLVITSLNAESDEVDDVLFT